MSRPNSRQFKSVKISNTYALSEKLVERFEERIKNAFARKKENFKNNKIAFCIILFDNHDNMTLASAGDAHLYLRFLEDKGIFRRDKVKYVELTQRSSEKKEGEDLNLLITKINLERLKRDLSSFEGKDDEKNILNKIIFSSVDFVESFKHQKSRNGICDVVAHIDRTRENEDLDFEKVSKSADNQLSSKDAAKISGKNIDSDQMKAVIDSSNQAACALEFIEPEQLAGGYYKLWGFAIRDGEGPLVPNILNEMIGDLNIDLNDKVSQETASQEQAMPSEKTPEEKKIMAKAIRDQYKAKRNSGSHMPPIHEVDETPHSDKVSSGDAQRLGKAEQKIV